MSALTLLRGLLVLLAVPLLTLFYSLATLTGLFLLRQDQETIQRYPRQWARAICKLAGVKVVIQGAELLDPQATYIYCANHASQFDIFSFQGHFPLPFRWLAKEELSRIPFLGAAMARAGTIFINRSKGRQAMKSLSQAAAKINEGTSVLIFPEGTRSADGRLLPFKGGAMVLGIKASIPLVPVAFTGSHQVLAKGSCWPRPGTITITIGEPIATTDYNSRQKHELAQVVQERVSVLLSSQST